jgi:CDP-diacylglycerol---serine O-phosphatidyltransferase
MSPTESEGKERDAVHYARPLPIVGKGRRLRPPRLNGTTINALLPNMLTVLNLAFGMTAIRFAIDGKWHEAVLAIAIAALFDALDGRIARMLNAQSKFGEELDSLSDIVSFGAAPALILYMWELNEARTIGWMTALLLVICAGLRLARFNTMLGAPEKPAFAYHYFTGVPVPAGAFLALLPLILTLEFGPGWFDTPFIGVPWTLGVATLMISPIPTFSMKGIRVPQRHVIFVLLGVGGATAAFVNAPWASLSACGLFYVGSIPFSARRYARQAREAALAQAGREPTQEHAAPPL